jgi:hypothetical protein
MYPKRGYGGNFEDWIYEDDPEPYNSWGNGSAMRAIVRLEASAKWRLIYE